MTSLWAGEQHGKVIPMETYLGDEKGIFAELR
jgi:hypothetical protein